MYSMFSYFPTFIRLNRFSRVDPHVVFEPYVQVEESVVGLLSSPLPRSLLLIYRPIFSSIFAATCRLLLATRSLWQAIQYTPWLVLAKTSSSIFLEQERQVKHAA